MNLKQKTLGSMVGRALLSGRDRIELVAAALNSPERVGTIANDQLASRLVVNLCASEKIFLDVGAHIGSVIAAVRHHDPSIQIIAIEAMPDKVAALRKKFPGVRIHSCAVGDYVGEVPFFIDTERSGYSSLISAGHTTDARVQITVPIRRLDDFVAAEGVDVIKVDVEGAELGVFRGSQKILASSQPVIMFESAPGDANGLGFSKEDMWHFFDERDYDLLIPNRVAHDGVGLDLNGFIESHLYPRRTTNYFAIPKERRIEIRDRSRNILNMVVG